MAGMITICFYGGAFDPVHNGHIHFAKHIVDTFNPDAFIFIPTYFSPYKGTQKYADDSHRLQMLEIATRFVPNSSVSRCEIDRKGISYTIDTLKAFRALYPLHRLMWVIGDDHLQSLEKWKGYPEHFDHCDFIVLPRHDRSDLKDRIALHPFRQKIHALSANIIPISSSQIRTDIAEGKSILSYVPKEINDYIHANKLYR